MDGGEYNNEKCVYSSDKMLIDTSSKNKGRSILKDLEEHPLPEEIKRTAEIIFQSMKVGIRRKRHRKKLLWYCVYQAHKELNITVVAEHLARMFGLENKDMAKAGNMFSKLQTGYEPPTNITIPEDLITRYCGALGLSEDCCEAIVTIIKNVKQHESFDRELSPQIIAGAAIKYYMFYSGIKLANPKELYKIIGKSEVTIGPIYKKIMEIDNE